MPAAARKHATYADLARLPEDGNRHEIIEGEWFMTPPPTTDHQLVASRILVLLDAWVRPRKLGWVMGEVGVSLGRAHFVEPDVVFLSVKKKALRKKAYLSGPPNLVIEVLSPATATVDRGRKLVLYRHRDVREYWIADPAERTIEVYDFGSPRRRSVFQEGQSFEVATLPGLKIEVNEVFSVLD